MRNTSKKTNKPLNSGLLKALFTRTQMNVLGLIFTQPEKKFYVSEIISHAQCGSGSVQRELAKLFEAGLVTNSKHGSLKLYQANKDSPIFKELQSIFSKSFGVGQLIKQSLLEIKTEIELALIFGSIASAADHAQSDIDLMIVSDDLSLEEVYDCLESVEISAARKISPIIYSRFEFEKKRKARHSFLNKVLKSPYEVLIGSLDEK